MSEEKGKSVKARLCALWTLGMSIDITLGMSMDIPGQI